MKLGKKHLSSVQVIALGFLLAISAGCILLMLPVSTRSGQGAPFWDALFTATSAVCVTGLIVHDTATYWSTFGQVVLLLLIQIGGMGVVTVSVSIATVSGRKIGLMQRSTMQEAIAAPNMRGIVRLTRFILMVTFATELLGALVMAPVFCNEFGIGQGIWYACFHSISAFCNAGFDLMGVRETFSSLTGFVGHPVINITIMLLIIWGGIGFLTWNDIRENRFCFKKYRMQSKVILVTTLILLALPAIYLYAAEFSRDVWSGMSVPERIYAALFQSVTARTAGFNTVDLSQMSGTSQLFMIILMMIGGSPGSTAGGMKTTTVAILFASMIAVFLQKDEAHFWGRRVSVETIRQAAAILMLYISLFLAGSIAISVIEQIPIIDCMFEAASAIATVGVTLGITTQLGIVSRFILICLMFLGRVGGLTIIFAAISSHTPKESRYPLEKITVG